MPRIVKYALLATVVGMVALMNAPLAVVAHHDNEAEHAVAPSQGVLKDGASGVTPVDLPPTPTAKAPPAKSNTMSNQAPEDLKIEVVSLPSNAASLPKAATGQQISVHYTGTLFATGAQFDSSHVGKANPKPFKLTLGVGQVIKGWDEGIQGMVVGEKRKLTIPPGKAYGSRGFSNLIPPYSTLVFDVELLGIEGSGRQEL
ncbi:hypothetical protein M408DRAFT_333650 [Serendipita vermifera MAFF 305830]|uniref:peptidylprolyl isomerase n=1 Tax=Serendipita vermifera MAFF 305830 TaxID=933852 RepID=A0A0C3APF6_SERVB|nr:hypothetical protein M408DRAFT_333650 [Serendipita vermifera MAFF 305830]